MSEEKELKKVISEVDKQVQELYEIPINNIPEYIERNFKNSGLGKTFFTNLLIGASSQYKYYRVSSKISIEKNEAVLNKINEYCDKKIKEMDKALPQQTHTENEQSKNEVGSKNDTNHFCKSMPLEIPIKHFEVFTKKNSKNKAPFLTIEQYNSFIDRAFYGNTKILKQKFNQAPKGEKLLIQAVFYEFYNSQCFEYFNTMQCQDIFIKLLTENFEGWEYKNVKENFKPKTNKRL